MLRRDVGGTTPAVEHYTQPPDDFAGLLAHYSTGTSQPQFFFSDMSQNIGAVANGSTVNEYHFFQAFGQVLPTSTTPTAQPFGFGGNAQYYTDPISGMQIAWNRIFDAVVGQWAIIDE